MSLHVPVSAHVKLELMENITCVATSDKIYVHVYNECTKVQNPRRPCVRESLKAHMLDLYNAHVNAGKTRAIETLYTARSAIILSRAVCMLVFPHAVTTGASLYIEQEYLITGKPE